MQAEDWLRRESGILALGAVAEGWGDELAPYMGEVLPVLLAATEDPRPLIRK